MRSCSDISKSAKYVIGASVIQIIQLCNYLLYSNQQSIKCLDTLQKKKNRFSDIKLKNTGCANDRSVLHYYRNITTVFKVAFRLFEHFSVSLLTAYSLDEATKFPTSGDYFLFH